MILKWNQKLKFWVDGFSFKHALIMKNADHSFKTKALENSCRYIHFKIE